MTRPRIESLIMVLLSLMLAVASAWTAINARILGRTEFYVAQAVFIISLMLLWLFRSRVLKPLRAIANGINLLREQDFSSRLRPVGQYEADKIVAMFNEIMGQLKNERLHIREQNHFLDLLIGASPMGIIVLDTNNRISMLNNAAASMLGIDSNHAKGTAIESIKGPLAEAVMKLGYNEIRTIRLSNSMIYRCSRLSYMDRGFHHPFLLVEKLTDEVMQAERTAYEKVIRMMAHEVNNSMAGVNSIIETAADVIDNADISEALSACRQRCIRMSEFITSFANVVKIPEASLQNAELNTFTLDCRRVLESMCSGRDIALHIVPCKESVNVMLDSTLMEQVLINIVKNSIESIGSNGKIRVQVFSTPPQLIVEDNGPGISEACQEKIFSPFFSSKASGRGLGLLFAADVLNKHRCTFSLRTDTNGMTRFCISFP